MASSILQRFLAMADTLSSPMRGATIHSIWPIRKPHSWSPLTAGSLCHPAGRSAGHLQRTSEDGQAASIPLSDLIVRSHVNASSLGKNSAVLAVWCCRINDFLRYSTV